jgi:hypothetical protein
MVSPKPHGTKRDMVQLLTDENNPLGDTACVANIKGTESGSDGVRNPNAMPLQKIDDNGGTRKRHRNLPSRYRE